MFSLRNELLKTCFREVDTTFASGKKANNKLDLELLAENPKLEKLVIRGLGRYVHNHNPDFVVGVPNGATRLADEVSQAYSLPCIYLNKDEQGVINFATPKEREISEEFNRGVLIEDVINEYTSTRKVLAMPELAGKIVAVEAVFDRGNPDERQPLGIPMHAQVSQYIPPILPASLLREYTHV